MVLIQALALALVVAYVVSHTVSSFSPGAGVFTTFGSSGTSFRCVVGSASRLMGLSGVM